MRSTQLFSKALWALAFFAILMAGCDEGTVGNEEPSDRTFTFENSSENWTGDFADYPTYETAASLELEFERRRLPEEVEDGMGLYFAGLNTPDDLFMYAKHELTGLEPSTTYRVGFRLVIASNSPSGCVGIGGPPGEAVAVLVGASPIEPESVVQDEHYRLNIDKDVNDGEPAEQGAVAHIGDVGNGLEQCTEEVPYRMIERSNLNEPLSVTTNQDGNLWVFVGTDSGFEGKTTLYYDEIEVAINR